MEHKQHPSKCGRRTCRSKSQNSERPRARARAQMRSVDFALALIIFVILLVYLILAASGTTNTAFYETQQRTQEMGAYNTALQIIENTGTPHAWSHNLEEFPEVFGLGSAKMEEASSEFVGTALDAGKIARIDPVLENVELKHSCPYLYVPYPIARRLIATMDKNYQFSIEIIGIIEVGIHVTLQGAELEIESTVMSQNHTQEGATVWTYILDPRGGLLDYSESTTNANGITPMIEMNLPRPGAYVVVTIAVKSSGYGYDFKIINYNTVRELEVLAFAQPHTRPGTGEILQYLIVKPEVVSNYANTFTVEDTNATVLYVGGRIETVPLDGNGSLQRGEAQLRAREPQIIVTRVQIRLNHTLAYGVGITAIPLILGDNNHPAYHPPDQERDPVSQFENKYVMKRLVIVQGIPMIVIVKLWEIFRSITPRESVGACPVTDKSNWLISLREVGGYEPNSI